MKTKQENRKNKIMKWKTKQENRKTIEGKRKEMEKHNNKQNNKNVKNIPLANASRCSTVVRVPIGERCKLFTSGTVRTAGERATLFTSGKVGPWT